MGAPAPILDIGQCVRRLRAGGVVVYPTEAVWGLGCDPSNTAAVERLLAIKQRDPDKGLILVGARAEDFASLVDFDALDPDRRDEVLSNWPGPHTWVLPCRASVPALVRGQHAGLAVRASAHPQVAALCRRFGGPLVSTSANRAGEPPVARRVDLDPALVALIDGVLDGETGGLAAPTPIRDARTGMRLRG